MSQGTCLRPCQTQRCRRLLELFFHTPSECIKEEDQRMPMTSEQGLASWLCYDGPAQVPAALYPGRKKQYPNG